MIFDGLFGEESSTPRRRTIPKAVKDTVWKIYIGYDKAVGKCYVCGEYIHMATFDLGHNTAVAKGGKDHISNLRPICRTCNTSMGTQSIEKFKKKYFGVLEPEIKSKDIQTPRIEKKASLQNANIKKQRIESPETNSVKDKAQIKRELASLTLQQLKLLANKHKVKVSGSVEEGLSVFGVPVTAAKRFAPTKSQYVTKLAKVVTEKDLRSVPK